MTALVDKLEKELAGNWEGDSWDLGFKTAIDIVKQHNEWVSVNERLPDDDENVLVYSGDKEMFIAWCGVIGRTWRDSFRDAPYDELVGISITHWMPLPQPPSEVQND